MISDLITKKKVSASLKKNKIYLDIKMHPYRKIDTKSKRSIESDYIHFLDSEVSETIQNYCMIINDYSSLYRLSSYKQTNNFYAI